VAYSSLNSDKLTRPIIGAAIEVHTILGPGFLESIYRKALLHELQLRGMATQSELPVEVSYKNQIVGNHRLDLIVDGVVVIELKAVTAISPAHLAQILSYMRALDIDTGLVFNFGEDRLRWKRILNKPRIERM
jgi:GxxExxY protein